MCHLVNLKVISFINNKLKYLPEDIGLLINLRKLKLQGNQHLKCLPKSIGKARRLVLIEVDSENFVYPPGEVVEGGAEVIKKYISNGKYFL